MLTLLDSLLQRIEDIGELVIPAPHLLGGMEFPERGPDTQLSIGHRELRKHELPVFEVAQNLQGRRQS